MVSICLCLSVSVKSQEYERAASLAEKYCDFSTLIEICEELNNEERLWRYLDQFKNDVSWLICWLENLYMLGSLSGKCREIDHKLGMGPFIAIFMFGGYLPYSENLSLLNL